MIILHEIIIIVAGILTAIGIIAVMRLRAKGKKNVDISEQNVSQAESNHG